MSQSFAELVLSANTSGLRAARGDLRNLTGEGERTEKRTSKAMGGIGTAAKLVGGALAALGAISWASGGIRQAREYGAAMSEVSTLIEGTPAQMKAAETATRNFAKQFGTSATQQAQAYYQAVSGGAAAGAEAAALLESANKLAIAGVTDVASAVGILTSATNVYADSGLSAADASDALFVAVRAGVTTIPELAGALGSVLPLAQKLGLSFDEVAAATAALTKGGINTSESVTGINAALTSIIGPSKQASDLAESLGLEFNSAALETKGFAQFMADAVEATGGGADAMRTLFGSTEATKIALALAGTAGADMNAILGDMASKAGATGTAFGKMSEDMNQRLKVVQSRFADLQLGVGDALLTVLVPVMEKAADAAQYFADAIPVEKIAAAAQALMEWDGLGMLAAGLGAVAVAAGALAFPFIAAGVAASVAATYLFTNWDSLRERFPAITGAMIGAVDMAKAAWSGIKGAFADLAPAFDLATSAVSQVIAGDFAGAWVSAKAAVAVFADWWGNLTWPDFDWRSIMPESVDTATLDQLETSMRAVYDAVAAFGTFAKGAVTDYFFAMFDGFKETIDPVRESLADAWAQVGPILDNVKEIGNELSALFSSNAANEASVFGEVGRFMGIMAGYAGQGIGLVLEGVARGLETITGAIVGLLQGDMTRVQAEFTEFFDWMTAGIQMPDWVASFSIGDMFPNINFTAMKEWFGGLFDFSWGDIRPDWFDGFSIGDMFGGGDAAQTAAAVKADLQSVNELSAAIASAQPKITALEGEVSRVLTSVSGMVNEANIALAGWATRTPQHGKDAIDGFIQGILSRKSAAIAAAKSVADAVDKAARDALQIRSPSRKMMKVGEHTVEGMVLGIESQTGALVSQITDTANQAVQTADQTLAQGFGSMVDYMIDGFKGGMSGLIDIFKNTLKQMAAAAIKNKIMIGFGLSGGPAAAGQIAGAPGGAGGILGGLSKGFSSLLGTWGGAGGILGGASSVLAGITGGGLSGGIGAIGTALSGATTGLAGFGAAIGAVALPLAAVAAVFSFFKKKTKELDAGLRFTIDGMDTLVQSFSKTETKRFWGLSKKTGTSYTDLSDKEASPLIAATDAIQGSVVTAAAQLGFAADAFDGFSHQFSVSLKGLDEAGKQAAIAEALEGLGDEMAAMILGVGDKVTTASKSLFGLIALGGKESFDNSGMYEELIKLSSSLGAVNQTFDTLGRSAFALSLASGRAAAEIVDLAGGLDNFSAISTAYYQGFYSDAERFATAQRQIGEQFDALNIAMPKSRAEFRQMVDALDVSTEGGRKMYVALVSMSGALDQTLPAVMNFTAAIAAMGVNVTGMIDAIIGDTSNAMRANEQAAALWYRTAETLRGFIADMRGTASALVSGGQARAFAEMRFQTLLASAIGGDNEAAGDLTTAARTLLDNTRATARTSLEMARAEARVLGDLQKVSGVSDIEGARHDVVAGLLGQQVELLGTVRDAINSGNPLSPSDLDGLSGQLGALESAIAAAEMINYAFLKERLAVTVDLIADAKIPAALRTLLNNAATGITANIDYIVRADGLTPDLRWLALTGTSEHISTLKTVAVDKLDPWTRWIAVTTSSALAKTVNLLVGSKLDADTMRLGLAGSSELLRTVNVVLGANVSEAAKRLALGSASMYNVAVQVAMGSAISADIRKIVFGDVGAYTASIQAALSATMPDWARRVLLTQQGNFAVNVSAVLSTGLPDAMKSIILDANTTAMRAITILAAYGSSLTAEQRELLTMQSAAITKTIQGNVGFKDMTADDWKLFSMGNVSNTKTIIGNVDTSKLSTQQLTLLNAVTGSTAGNLNLGGSFSFDPSGSFSTWFGATTQTNISVPMSGLRASLLALTDEMRANTLAAQDQLKSVALASALAGTDYNAKAKYTSPTGWKGEGAFEASFSDLYGLSKSLGVSLKWADGAAKGTNALRLQVESALRAAGSIAADQMLWLSAGNAGSASVNAGWTDWMKTQNVPAFASGGMHSGGVRLVGENGPELEVTGPSQIYSAPKTKAMLGGSDNSSSMAMRTEIAELRRVMVSLVKFTKRISDLDRKHDIEGTPPVRVA